MSVRKRTWTTPSGQARSAWVVDYQDGSHKRRLKTFAKKKDADAFASRSAVEIDDGIHVADRASVSVSAAADLWLESVAARGLERTTIEAYRSQVEFHIRPMIGSVLISRLSIPTVRDFEDQLRRSNRSHAMIQRIIGSLGAIISDAQERGLAVRNPVRDIRGRRQGVEKRRGERAKGRLQIGREIPTREEIKALVEALTSRWRPILLTAIFTGLRASELRGLRWSDVDLQKRELHVRQRADRFGVIGRPKSAAGERTVPMPAMLAATLREWKVASPPGAELVFPNGAGRIESLANIINRGLWPAMLKAGIVNEHGQPKYKGMHALRHFYASWCINPVNMGGMGLPPKVVQEQLGHSTISMTLDVYGHLFPRGDVSDQMDAAERLLLG